MALPIALLMRDTRANQPLAAHVAQGTVFCVTDEGFILEQSDGAAWNIYSPGGVKIGVATTGQYASATVAQAGTEVDWADGNVQTRTLDDDIEFTFANGLDGGRYLLAVESDGGPHVITWPGAVVWPSDVVPTPSGDGAVDLYTFVKIGGVYFGAALTGYAP